MVAPICIDISHHNPEPEWDVIKAAGVVGVIFKATEGSSYQDPTLFPRSGAAKRAGLLTATYHFMRPGSMADQMDWYINTIDPVQGERVILDHEDAGVSLIDLATAVEYLLSVRPDLQVTIYSGHLIKEQLGDGYNEILGENTSLWIAQYTSQAAPTWPQGTWPAWSLWQYTDSAVVDGISEAVDGNRWNGNRDGFIKWMTPGKVPVVPVVGQVHVNIQATPGVTVSVAVNGVLINGKSI